MSAKQQRPVMDLVQRGSALLRQRQPARDSVDAFLIELAALSPEELLHFDAQVWFWVDGRSRYEHSREPQPPAGFRGRLGRILGRTAGLGGVRSVGADQLREILALVSRNGHEREWAIGVAKDDALVARLVAIRTADWVEAVRRAAIARVERSPQMMLIEALPIAVRIEARRYRGGLLLSHVLSRLTAEELWTLVDEHDARVRREAWRQLFAEGAVTTPEQYERVVRDPDSAVRLMAVRTITSLSIDVRRRVAERFADDPVGSVAAPALEVLIDLDGDTAIRPALVAASQAKRRVARGWAARTGIDARDVVLARLDPHPQDRDGLLALAEIASPEDRDHFAAMLDDPRTRIRAAGLRALALVDASAGRAAALAALGQPSPGPVTRAATEVLRSAAISDREATTLEQVALDRGRLASHRFRALGLLAPRRWHYLAVALEAYAVEDRATARDEVLAESFLAKIQGWNSTTLARAPSPELRVRILAHLEPLTDHQRLQVEFAVRTSS